MFPPLVLLADSQLLFHRTGDGAPFLAAPLALAAEPVRRAAYLGASNGDAPEFYELFTGAMELVGVRDCRHVKDDAAADDLAFLERADLVLLAGGDADRGMRSFERSGARARVVDAYLRGAVLVGTSAGAMQLGVLDEAARGFGFVPFAIGVHDEPEWSELRRRLALAGAGARAVGIPAGGGALYHRDGTLEPVRHALAELVVLGDGSVADTLLVP